MLLLQQAQQVLLDVLGVKSPRVEQLEIVQKLKKYQQLVDSNDWDTEEALKLRQTLNQWGAGYEPELVSLDVDIRLKSLDR